MKKNTSKKINKKLSSKLRKKKKSNLKFNSANSPTKELKLLLKFFQNKNYQDAKNLAISISSKHPDEYFPWFILGKIFSKEGNLNDALNAQKRSIEIKPKDFDAFYNLGNTQQALHMYEDAELSYKSAILLSTNDFRTYYNLGKCQYKLEKYYESEENFKNAIRIQPDNDFFYNDLGITLKNNKKIKEAEEVYKKGIELNPKNIKLLNNLGNLFFDNGKIKDAISINQTALSYDNSNSNILLRLSENYNFLNNTNKSIVILESILEGDKSDDWIMAAIDLALFRFLENDDKNVIKLLLKSDKVYEKTSLIFSNYKVYHYYLSKIIKWREKNNYKIGVADASNKLFVIGESHSLVSHGITQKKLNEYFISESILIKGCTQFSLGNHLNNKYKYKFENIINSLPKKSYILLAIGEIDCRIDTGILAHKRKNPEKDINELIETTIQNYLHYLEKKNSLCGHKINIQAIPCPNIDRGNHSEEDISELINLIKKFNDILKKKSLNLGFGFLDLHLLTDRGDGFSNNIWHIDPYHLSPSAMIEAWNKHFYD